MAVYHVSGERVDFPSDRMLEAFAMPRSVREDRQASEPATIFSFSAGLGARL